ncbi:MAG: DNA polymerase III subunit delta', partial [Rhizobiaceae bacterium]
MFERLAPLQHDTLDGVPEPRETFALYGHAAAAGQLAQAFAGDKLHHALLFAGPQGVGKATLAFALARHMLAFPNRADRPPFLAASEPGSALFRQVAQAAHPGVLHLTRPYD